MIEYFRKVRIVEIYQIRLTLNFIIKKKKMTLDPIKMQRSEWGQDGNKENDNLSELKIYIYMHLQKVVSVKEK